MANLEQSILQLRKEIADRVRESARLFEKSDATIAAGEVDKGIELSVRATATKNAVTILKAKLEGLLPALVSERYAAGVRAIDERAKKSRAALVEEATRAADRFREFFWGWNLLIATGLGHDAARQLLGDFGLSVQSAATDRIYLIAIDRLREAKGRVIDSAAAAERGELKAKIQREVQALGNVDDAESGEEQSA